MTVTTVAVLGAGIMGRGIAYVAAVHGFTTRLMDTSGDALDRARSEIETLLDTGLAAGKIETSVASAARGRMSFSDDLTSATRDTDLVVEAVPEDLALKLQTFSVLDRTAPSHAILATNTSSLSITEMAAATQRPQRVVGMHFFNPVHRMRLVEIVRGLETSEEVVEMARQVGERMGKECVVVRESPGFVTTRVNALIGNEAFYMLQEGVASARDIDTALKLGLNHPMGPFELVDLVGLDTRLSILRYLHRTLGEKYRPCPLLVQYVAAGRLGRKTGRGVYEYPEQTPVASISR
jgi:3-hydroxybutyryl-CoA dehydrogenase